MKLVKYDISDGVTKVGLLDGDDIRPLDMEGGQFRTLSDLLEASDVPGTVQFMINRDAREISIKAVSLLPPVDRQEVWAAGVTYRRSQKARMDESESAASFYDKVYTAARPELFFKALAHRVVGPEQNVRVRHDSDWSVPEPELALVLNSSGELVGFTIGNDMSARDIEGENPLYLPQAKVYDQSCALGPCITLVDSMPPLEETEIRMVIRRGGETAFEGQTDLTQLARKYSDLTGYLQRDNSFPDGVVLLTGTGIVPPDEFTLEAGDEVEISIDGIGTLVNPVVKG